MAQRRTRTKDPESSPFPDSGAAMYRVRFALFMVLIRWLPLGAQEADPRPLTADTTLRYPNNTAGEFTPASGFQIFRNDRASLNISAYGLFRYINQMPAAQTFVDHLGQTRNVNPRNDVNWQRTMIWLTGFFYTERFRYNVTAWSLGATQQTLIFGNVQFLASKYFTFGVGILPNLTGRSMQGSFPFWAGSDRQMAEE